MSGFIVEKLNEGTGPVVPKGAFVTLAYEKRIEY
jgi:hypothetical protein